MNKLVEKVEIMSVADLYLQYQRFARHYDLSDNPLKELTARIPASATYYAVVPVGEQSLTATIMKKLAGRKKLRQIVVHKDEVRLAAFTSDDRIVIYYV